MKTRQEIFDISSRHLLAQMVQSRAADAGRCQYRGPNGTKCAVGALITDAAFASHIEQWHANESRLETGAVLSALLASDVDVDDPDIHDLCLRLQGIHDCYPPEHWAEELADLAEEFELAAREKPNAR